MAIAPHGVVLELPAVVATASTQDVLGFRRRTLLGKTASLTRSAMAVKLRKETYAAKYRSSFQNYFGLSDASFLMT